MVILGQHMVHRAGEPFLFGPIISSNHEVPDHTEFEGVHALSLDVRMTMEQET